LHLVDAEERPVAAAQLLGPLEVALGWEEGAMALDRLDEEERDLFACELGFERVQIAPGHLGEPGQERQEPVAELWHAVCRESAERVAVETALAGDDPRPARGRTAQLDRRLDRLGAGAREEDSPQALRRPAQELVRKQRRQ